MLKIKLKPYQQRFVYSLARYPAFIGGWGTGKTLCGILRGLILSQEISGNTGLIIRKEYTDLRDSTIADFERYTGLRVDANKNVRLPNGSVIMFRHGSELDVLKNVNLGWFMIEQAEEFESDEQFHFLRGRPRRLEGIPFRTGFIIGNTAGHNWIWRLWKQQQNPEYELIEATTFDNADNLPQDFIEDLKRLEKESPHHYARYVMNSWEDFEDIDTLIPYHYVRDSIIAGRSGSVVASLYNGGAVLSCDPAHYGDDETVITIIQRVGEKHYRQIYLEGYKGQDLMQTAGRIIDLTRRFSGIDYVVIDDIGVGTGLSDRLNEQLSGDDGGGEKRKIGVVRFKASAAAIDEGFYNKRSECYWKLREFLRCGFLELLDNDTQTQQLCSIKFKFKSNGKKYIESKEDARRRGVKSPDYADALMMAVSVAELVVAGDRNCETASGGRFWDMVKLDLARERERFADEDSSDYWRDI